MEYASADVTASLTVAGRQALLDWTLGTSSVTAPGMVWVALCTAIPADDDDDGTLPEIPLSYTNGTNIISTGYARASYPFADAEEVDDVPAWTSRGYGVYANTRTVEFDPAAGDWPQVRGWALTDAPTGGAILAYGAVDLTVESGDVVEIPPGALSLISAALVI